MVQEVILHLLIKTTLLIVVVCPVWVHLTLLIFNIFMGQILIPEEKMILFLNDSMKGYECIWDSAGIDTIDASQASMSSTLDLRNATLKNEVGGGGFVSEINGEYKGFTIAYNSTGDCIIENALGSNFNDRITGNEYSNTIYGLNGADEIFARGGNDLVYGGFGNDIIHGSFYGDSSNSIDTLTGGSGSDYFVLGDSSGLFYTNSL